jgi:hypothetical protein
MSELQACHNSHGMHGLTLDMCHLAGWGEHPGGLQRWPDQGLWRGERHAPAHHARRGSGACALCGSAARWSHSHQRRRGRLCARLAPRRRLPRAHPAGDHEGAQGEALAWPSGGVYISHDSIYLHDACMHARRPPSTGWPSGRVGASASAPALTARSSFGTWRRSSGGRPSAQAPSSAMPPTATMRARSSLQVCAHARAPAARMCMRISCELPIVW